MLECRNIHKHYGGVVALKGVSLELLPGEVHALCGENGAGKSTLARILCRHHRARWGEILLEGQARHLERARSRRGRRGRHHPAGARSLRASLHRGKPRHRQRALEPSPGSRRAALHDAASRCSTMSASTLDPALPLDTLSVSQWQLVAIARVLGLDAKIIFMDEPTSALTDDAVERLFGLIARLKERGVAIVYVSHKMDEIFRICDRVSVMRDGEIIGTQDVQRDHSSTRSSSRWSAAPCDDPARKNSRPRTKRPRPARSSRAFPPASSASISFTPAPRRNPRRGRPGRLRAAAKWAARFLASRPSPAARSSWTARTYEPRRSARCALPAASRWCRRIASARDSSPA